MSQINQRYILIVTVLITALVLLGGAIWYIPQMEVASLKEQVDYLNILKNSNTQNIDFKDLIELAQLEKSCIEAESAARNVIVQGTSVLFLFLTVLVAFFNSREPRHDIIVAEEKPVTEEFSKTIEQLGNASFRIRMEAINALEEISKTSDKHYWQVMEILTAYVREASPYLPNNKANQDKVKNTYKNKAKNAYKDKIKDTYTDSPFIATDIQAVLTVISRRAKSYNQGEENRLDLSKSDLSRAKLESANLKGANLKDTNLKGADLKGADLEGAILKGVILKGADLKGANLKGADFRGAILKGANLKGANLEGVNLEGAVLGSANLEGAILKGANLKGADLRGVVLTSADLKGANLEGADLEGAILEVTNLEVTNLESANLEGANLKGANLKDAVLEDAVLDGAVLRGAILKGTIFKNAILEGAILKGAKNLTFKQIKKAKNWHVVKYDKELRASLGLS